MWSFGSWQQFEKRRFFTPLPRLCQIYSSYSLEVFGPIVPVRPACEAQGLSIVMMNGNQSPRDKPSWVPRWGHKCNTPLRWQCKPLFNSLFQFYLLVLGMAPSSTITEKVSLLSLSPKKSSERTESFKDKPTSFRTNTTQPQKNGYKKWHNDRQYSANEEPNRKSKPVACCFEFPLTRHLLGWMRRFFDDSCRTVHGAHNGFSLQLKTFGCMDLRFAPNLPARFRD